MTTPVPVDEQIEEGMHRVQVAINLSREMTFLAERIFSIARKLRLPHKDMNEAVERLNNAKALVAQCLDALKRGDYELLDWASTRVMQHHAKMKEHLDTLSRP